jgi:hypothetical protein
LSTAVAPPGLVGMASPTADKLALYADRFRARADVYAVRWDNTRTGASGWMPAVAGGWRRGTDRKRVRYLRGVEVPHWVVVHGVDGVGPGVYRWPDLWRPVRSRQLRDELVRVCTDQGLAGDAAYVVVGAARLSGLDDRSYRNVQLAAGLVEGRLHLAAYALGASASGVTFLDRAVPELLGEPDDLAALLFTCVGVPAYQARRRGRPGAPTTFRPVEPRIVPAT